MPDEPVIPKRAVIYVCAQCGSPGVVDPGYTLVDPRYATGRCSGDHRGQQYLVSQDVGITPKKSKKKVKTK
jgi:hypothetical protein